jgi:hypothetical protein
VVVAIAGTACSGDSSMAPTGPSSAQGARIAGRVVGAPVASIAATSGLTASPLTQSSSTTGSLTVKVNGTNIETNVDGSGRFTLNGVPSGTIVLNFSGRGINADVTITGINTGDQITIEVRLENGRARVETERRDHGDDQGEDDDDDDDDDDDEDEVNRDGRVEVKGSVSNLTGTCPDLRFMVGTRPVKTSIFTSFDDVSCMRVQNTMRVEVKGVVDPADGMVAATRVERD